MPGHEPLPTGAFSQENREFLARLDAGLRPKHLLQKYQQELLSQDPELFREIATKSAELAPGNPRLHAFYFTEFLLLTAAVRRIENTETFEPEWADNPPILSY